MNAGRRISWRAAWCVCVGVLLVGCGSNQEPPERCVRSDATLPAAVDVTLKEQYGLVLKATKGDSAGRELTGTIRLMRSDTTHFTMTPAATVPYYGTLDADLAALAIPDVGNSRSTDQDSAGVLVLVNRTPERTSITLRVGSESNRRDIQRFEGAYFALHVKQVNDSGFSGDWTAGETGEESAGYFCAYAVE